MSDRTKAYIDINALHHNINQIKKIAPHSRILAMVKSNAYGHGLVAIAKILQEVDGFGVACLDEALKLRAEGVTAPCIVMSGVYNEKDLQQVANNDITIVIHDFSQIELLKNASINQPLNVWLEIDTGMHRLGFLPDMFKKAYTELLSTQKVKLPLTIMTHLADGDDIHKATTQQQAALFKKLTQDIKCSRSIANSAGILAWPDTLADWNRPGIMLYGISPMLDKNGSDHGLIPVLTLKSKIFAIHEIKRGDAIGYGGTWVCPEDMRIATVAVGYGDGYPRHAKNGTPTLINNKICKLVGRVSMDLITVDLANCPEAKIGDDVTLWGNGLAAETVAKYSDTIAYELMCNLSQRVVFEYR